MSLTMEDNGTAVEEMIVDLNDLISPDIAGTISRVTGIFLSIICALGVLFNSINATVYVRMGLGDSVNVSLTALSVAELGASLALLVMYCFSDPDLVFHYFPVVALSSWVHVSFNRIASTITAFVALERYLCVAMPLRVKSLITSGRSTVIVVFIFLCLLSCTIPVYVSKNILTILLPGLNTTIWVFSTRDDHAQELESITLTFNEVALICAFAVVVISTLLLVVTLRKNTKWRSSVSSRIETISTRDRKIVKMITLISAVFILNYLPIVVATCAMLIVPGYNMEGRYKYFFSVTWAINFLLESTNATASIFVYLKMSSKFKAMLFSLFKVKSEIKSKRLF